MITYLRLQDFKNFADEKLSVGPFTVIIGTNASGKSNIRDAFRLLHGIGKGYTLAEIIGGNRGDWVPIRGAGNEITRFGCEELAIHMGMHMEFSAYPIMGKGSSPTGPVGGAKYYIRIRRDPRTRKFSVVDEGLEIRSKKVYSGEIFKETYVERGAPALVQLLNNPEFINSRKGYYWPYMGSIRDLLEDIRFFDLEPEKMRLPSFPEGVLGNKGENLSAALQEICVDETRKSILMEWLRELTPMDVRDLQFESDASDRIHLVIVEKNGRRVSSSSASDGTLRFLAMLAALFGNDSMGLCVFEEFDNGIHPARLRLLLDLIEQQTAKGRTQVVTTTHSPDLLSMLDDRTFENSTSVVCRLEDTQNAVIRSVAGLPDIKRLCETQGLGRLFASGWIENAIAFTEEGAKEGAV